MSTTRIDSVIHCSIPAGRRAAARDGRFAQTASEFAHQGAMYAVLTMVKNSAA